MCRCKLSLVTSFPELVVLYVQEEGLKKEILGLLNEAVSSQPALAELFLSVSSSSSSRGQV